MTITLDGTNGITFSDATVTTLAELTNSPLKTDIVSSSGLKIQNRVRIGNDGIYTPDVLLYQDIAMVSDNLVLEAGSGFFLSIKTPVTTFQSIIRWPWTPHDLNKLIVTVYVISTNVTFSLAPNDLINALPTTSNSGWSELTLTDGTNSASLVRTSTTYSVNALGASTSQKMNWSVNNETVAGQFNTVLGNAATNNLLMRLTILR